MRSPPMSRHSRSHQKDSATPSIQPFSPAPASRPFAPSVEGNATAPAVAAESANPANPDFASAPSDYTDRLTIVAPGGQPSAPLQQPLTLGAPTPSLQPMRDRPSPPIVQRLAIAPLNPLTTHPNQPSHRQPQPQAIAFSNSQPENRGDMGRSLPIQPKLTIGAPNDKYEQEADRVAQQVVQRLSFSDRGQSADGKTPPSQPNPSLQRETLPDEEDELQMKPLTEQIQRMELPDEDELQMKPILQREMEPDEEDELQMKPDSLQREVEPDEEDELQMKPLVQRQGIGAVAASNDLESAIQQSRGGGQPLADSIREPMEQAFGGVDFSGVNVHTDGRSDQLNRSIQAKAFTTGQDIFFRQGSYQPGSKNGQELLAHELTHVVQQSGFQVQRSRLQRMHTSPLTIQRTPLEDAINQLPKKIARKRKNLNLQLDDIRDRILPLFLDRTSIAQDLTPIPPKGNLSSQEWNQLVTKANTERSKEMPNLIARQQNLMNRLVARVHALKANAEKLEDDALVGKANHILRQAAILAVDFSQALPSERSSLQQIAEDFEVPVEMPKPINPGTYNAPTHFDAITATISTLNPINAPARLDPQKKGADDTEVETQLSEVYAHLKEAYVHYLLQKADSPGNLIGVFLGPEWFFGPGIPYNEKQKEYTLNTLIQSSCEFPNMVIVPGTMRYSPDNKTVINFAPVIYNGRLVRTIAKRFWGGDTSGVNDNFGGMQHEKRQKLAPEESRLFDVADVSFALDICQDTNVGIETAKKDYYSTLSPGQGVKVHLVTAGGAIPQQGSVATQPGGVVFGSDTSGAANFKQTDPINSTQANSAFLGQDFVVTGAQTHRGNTPSASTRDKEIKTTVNSLLNVSEGGGLKHLAKPIPIGGLANQKVGSMDIAQVESRYKELGKPDRLTDEEERALLQGIQQYSVWFQDKPEKIRLLAKMWLPIQLVRSKGGVNAALATELSQNLSQMHRNWRNTLTGLATGLPLLILNVQNDMRQFQQAQFATSTGLLTPPMTNNITDWLIDQLNSLHQQISGISETNCAVTYQRIKDVFQLMYDTAQDEVLEVAQKDTLKRYADTICKNAENAAKVDELLREW